MLTAHSFSFPQVLAPIPAELRLTLMKPDSSLALLSNADVTHAIISRRDQQLHILRSMRRGPKVQQRKTPLAQSTAFFLLQLNCRRQTLGPSGGVCVPTILGANTNGGILLFPIAGETELSGARGSLVVSRKSPCTFGPEISVFAELLCRVCNAVISPDGKADDSEPGYSQNGDHVKVRLTSVKDLDGNISLSQREREVAYLLIRDLSCKQIAAQLNMSSRTVEHHLERMKVRSGVSTLHGLSSLLVAGHYGPLSRPHETAHFFGDQDRRRKVLWDPHELILQKNSGPVYSQ
jgi:DNA-binding CsgD family transcriptional regulator